MKETSIPSPSNVSNDSKSTSGFSLVAAVGIVDDVVGVVVAVIGDDVFVVVRATASEKIKIELLFNLKEKKKKSLLSSSFYKELISIIERSPVRSSLVKKKK